MGEYWSDEVLPPMKRTRYSDRIEDLRSVEYPMLHGTTYLDHAATTPAPASLLAEFSQEFTQNLFGNPHSGSSASQLSTRRIDDTRLRVLQFFNADPALFDVVFVANATAGVKLVADAFRDAGLEDGGKGFQYTYHHEAHTSLVGVREMAAESKCLQGDHFVDQWLHTMKEQQVDGEASIQLQLFAYPGQSNMNGHRPDLQREWCRTVQRLRADHRRPIYSLFDAAGLVSTSPLDLSDPSIAPDFTVLSFYKIFGFPDLGALIVRKASGDVLKRRKYFGGGTVDMVVACDEPWHSKKESSYHARLEDGTVAFHNIVALDIAMGVHRRLYGSMEDVALHTAQITQAAADRLTALRHANGESVCQVFRPPSSKYGVNGSMGPIIAFNIKSSNGQWVGKSEVEKLASVKNFQLRTGTLCNPGGTACYLGLSSRDMKKNFEMGQRCGDEHDLMNGKPTGVVRISFGAMSSMADVEAFVNFIDEYFVDKKIPLSTLNERPALSSGQFFIESLTVFPIKSCAGFNVPPDQRWEVHPEGLAWDREWCLVHQGTGSALGQKRYPRMALLRPEIDVKNRVLRIAHTIEGTSATSLEIPLSRSHASTKLDTTNICTKPSASKVCGDKVEVQLYTSPSISTFFTEALGVPCTLARFPPRSSSSISRPMKFKPSLPPTPPSDDNDESSSQFKLDGPTPDRSILLSNESPILLISRSSVNRLNEDIKSISGSDGVRKAVPAASFRGNIIVAQEHQPGYSETPYIEDTWRSIKIIQPNPQPLNSVRKGLKTSQELKLDVLGPCQRCQMVCIDQKKGERHQEPYSTLAKTRRWDGKVWFGMHLSLFEDYSSSSSSPLDSESDDDNGHEHKNEHELDGNDIWDDREIGKTNRKRLFLRAGDVVVPQ